MLLALNPRLSSILEIEAVLSIEIWRSDRIIFFKFHMYSTLQATSLQCPSILHVSSLRRSFFRFELPLSISPQFLCLSFSFFVPDEQFSSVTMWWTWSCSLSLLFVPAFKTFSYLLNQTSEVYETLPVLFLCQWELVYQFSEKFINFYYPLPITFVVIFSWDLGGLHR